MPMTTKNDLTGYTLVLLATVFYGTAGIFGRMIFRYESAPLTVTTVRAAIAVCLMFLGFLVFQRDLLKIKTRDIYVFALYGFIGITCSSLCFFYAIKYTTVATAVMLMNTSPVIVVILSAIIFREPFTRQKFFSLLLTLGGVLLLVQCYNPRLFNLNLTGILFGVGASFCFATYTLVGKLKVTDYDALTVVFYALTFGTLFLIIFRTPQVLLQVNYPLQGWFWFFLQALVPTILASICYIGSLHHIEAGIASIVLLFEVVVAAFLAYIFLAEHLEFLQIIGAVLIIAGILLLHKKQNVEKRSLQFSSD
jgi:drug/metabolite transporter (DMT)-like permease